MNKVGLYLIGLIEQVQTYLFVILTSFCASYITCGHTNFVIHPRYRGHSR